jgi:hypothetical protein
MKAIGRRAVPYIAFLGIGALWLGVLNWRLARSENGPWRVELEHAVCEGGIDVWTGSVPLLMAMSTEPSQPGDRPVGWPRAVCKTPSYGALEFIGPNGTWTEAATTPYMVDRVGGAGRGRDILYIDLNGNGKIDPKERLIGKPMAVPDTLPIEEPTRLVDFGAVKPVQRKGAAKICHLRLIGAGPVTPTSPTKEEALQWLVGIVGCCKEGRVRLRGQNQTVRVFDGDGDGRTLFTSEHYPDTVDALRIGDGGVVPLRRLVLDRGRLLRVAIDKAGKAITFSRYTGRSGTVRVSAAVREGKIEPVCLCVTPAEGSPIEFTASPGDRVELPAGTYDLETDPLVCKTEGGMWLATAESTKLSVRANRETTLRIGTPLQVEVQTAETAAPGRTVSIGCRLVGGQGEEYSIPRLPYGSPGPAPPRVIVRDAAGDQIATAAMEAG